MIAVVHHPDYVAVGPAAGGPQTDQNRTSSGYRWSKNGAIHDLLRAEGERIGWSEPEPMPRRWLETVHVRKARSTLDVPLADGTGDGAYLETLEATLAPLLDAERPELVLYQAGVDPFFGDRLGRLALTEEGLIARERLIGRLMTERGIPLASTVGGGYGDDVGALAIRHVTAILTLADAVGTAGTRTILTGPDARQA